MTEIQSVLETEDTEIRKFVKPENFDSLPRHTQIFWLMHRAEELGMDYAVIPLRRGVAANAISAIKDEGKSYSEISERIRTGDFK